MTETMTSGAVISAQERAAVEFMASLPTVRWDDIEAAAEVTERIARRLGDDREMLGALVDRVRRTPELRKKCECHALDDKIVIWDDPEKGLRIRLRLANTNQYERVHNHRYSFTAYILRGAYQHTLYATDQPLDDTADVDRFWPHFIREEPAGRCITLHHDQLHTTITEPETISLMIQSPAQKRRAFMIRRSDGHVWWREGAADETAERRAEVQMSDERFEHWVTRLKAFGVL
ncbi:hypothetical protein ACWT_6096 [Actinoplanes sp. SE50]|uniref:hypothetical protein n=1 Tax=unclassified Actinoplanes TaxID=2626549 RepID=UPI00023ECA22|nr:MULTISPECIES: hypothetical protein [unclassified Actinoplanes]AEV87113.1 hypothetical protein ACPL_6228 [Actinoplanes sp. SE50/110]ATO85511.1 hypothetical protein ACWT_6096 [Actinoplanes sp. SE50]SLM02923.1 uncharacterized protein ACSP50_6208 [Actinoplanes sp. SE50/110]